MVPFNRTIVLTLVLLTTADITAAAYTIPKELLTFELLKEQFPWLDKDGEDNKTIKEVLEYESLWSQLEGLLEKNLGDVGVDKVDKLQVGQVKEIMRNLTENDPTLEKLEGYVKRVLGNADDNLEAKRYLVSAMLWSLMEDDIKPVELVNSFYEPLAISFIFLFALAGIAAIFVIMFACKRD